MEDSIQGLKSLATVRAPYGRQGLKGSILPERRRVHVWAGAFACAPKGQGGPLRRGKRKGFEI